jgi:hypothetical protein
MSGGTPVHRQWVLVLRDGEIVVDWGDGLVQNVFSGEFMQNGETFTSLPVQNSELEMLVRASRVDHYDGQQVWFINLPERPVRSID